MTGRRGLAAGSGYWSEVIGFTLAQINQKIQVVRLQPVVARGSVSKQVQPFHTELAAKGLDFGLALFDFYQHGPATRKR